MTQTQTSPIQDAGKRAPGQQCVTAARLALQRPKAFKSPAPKPLSAEDRLAALCAEYAGTLPAGRLRRLYLRSGADPDDLRWAARIHEHWQQDESLWLKRGYSRHTRGWVIRVDSSVAGELTLSLALDLYLKHHELAERIVVHDMIPAWKSMVLDAAQDSAHVPEEYRSFPAYLRSRLAWGNRGSHALANEPLELRIDPAPDVLKLDGLHLGIAMLSADRRR